MRFVLPCFLY